MGFFSALFGGGKKDYREDRQSHNVSYGGAEITINDPIEIRYLNFRGEEKTFTAEKSSIRRKKQHISAIVAPRGVRIALNKEKIQNLQDLAEVFAMLDKVPPSNAIRVMKFHFRRGTRSAKNEELKARFAEWAAYSLR